jgi:hypothetical protein
VILLLARRRLDSRPGTLFGSCVAGGGWVGRRPQSPGSAIHRPSSSRLRARRGSASSRSCWSRSASPARSACWPPAIDRRQARVETVGPAARRRAIPIQHRDPRHRARSAPPASTTLLLASGIPRVCHGAKRHARLGTVARTSARRVAHSASFRARSASATQTSRRWSKWRRDLVKRTAATVLRERLGMKRASE